MAAQTLLLALLAAHCAPGRGERESPKLKPPRAIVLMLGDDYGYANVGFAHGPLQAGNPEARTPHMDALAAEGIVLERHYVYKYCSPTRSSLMSGRLPTHVNQNNRNNDIEAASGCDLRYKFLAQKMKEAGYYTAMVSLAAPCRPMPAPCHSPPTPPTLPPTPPPTLPPLPLKA